jgi:hypothetical protein
LTTADAEHNMQEYSMAGFPGAIGSTDATQTIMKESVQYCYRQAHLGFKMTHTARTYSITVNQHRRRILSATRGYHPARWNDKTLALFDDLMQALHQGTILDDVPFELYAYDSLGAVVKQKYRGAFWLLVDKGYLAHPTTVPPTKTTTSRAEIRFSDGWSRFVRMWSAHLAS